VFLSNGPGDPAPLTYAIDNAKARSLGCAGVSASASPIQILGLAMAAPRSS